MSRHTLLSRVQLLALSLFISFFVCLLPTWSAADSPGVTPDSIKIGSCNALSGPTSFLGMQMVIGAKAYFSVVNAQGGINGRKLELETKDDGYEADRAGPCWESLQKADVFAAAFFVGTPTGMKYIPMAESWRGSAH